MNLWLAWWLPCVHLLGTGILGTGLLCGWTLDLNLKWSAWQALHYLPASRSSFKWHLKTCKSEDVSSAITVCKWVRVKNVLSDKIPNTQLSHAFPWFTQKKKKSFFFFFWEVGGKVIVLCELTVWDRRPYTLVHFIIRGSDYLVKFYSFKHLSNQTEQKLSMGIHCERLCKEIGHLESD